MRLPIQRIAAVALILLLTMLLAALWLDNGEDATLGAESTGAAGSYGKMTIDSGSSVDSTPIRDHAFGITFPFSPGGGTGTGKANFSAFEVTKAINAKSPTLATFISVGDHLEQVTVQVYEPGSTKVAMTYRLEEVVILEMAVSPGASDVENIALYYETIRWKVGDEVFCFDTSLHAAC